MKTRREPQTPPEYFAIPGYIESRFGRQQAESARHIRSEGTLLEQFVLEWCLDNASPLRAVADSANRWIAISYEELALQPEFLLRLLCSLLHLDDSDSVLAGIEKPSKTTDSSGQETRDWIRSGSSEHLIDRWVKQVSAGDVARCFEILETFGISAYSARSLLPGDHILHLSSPPNDGFPEALSGLEVPPKRVS